MEDQICKDGLMMAKYNVKANKNQEQNIPRIYVQKCRVHYAQHRNRKFYYFQHVHVLVRVTLRLHHSVKIVTDT